MNLLSVALFFTQTDDLRSLSDSRRGEAGGAGMDLMADLDLISGTSMVSLLASGTSAFLQCFSENQMGTRDNLPDLKSV